MLSTEPRAIGASFIWMSRPTSNSLSAAACALAIRDGLVPPTINLLPQDLICPLHVQERLGGSVNLFNEMEPMDNGLPKVPKTSYLRFWEWRSAGSGNGNAIFMPGATVPRDIFVRYAAYLSDAVDNSPTISTPWYGQPIPMLRVSDILGYYVAAEFAFSRGSEQARAALIARGEKAAAPAPKTAPKPSAFE